MCLTKCYKLIDYKEIINKGMDDDTINIQITLKNNFRNHERRGTESNRQRINYNY